ncbi:Hypothetical predicted protein [Olea europaea subsp. europaea]|uniref:Uncharacterized protein n=1 Tax=Olea europaea subsp. europaea TaxID=158383 RepID=A0A8S0SI62_OLEEU|nr:Hypothetical predicted protein [Olea europaea subsp. europaea]
MFEYQIAPVVLIECLRDRWIINTQDTRNIERPLGYKPDRRRPRSPPSVGNFPSVPAIDRRGNIIGEVMEEDEDPKKDPKEKLGHNPGEAGRDDGAGENF